MDPPVGNRGRLGTCTKIRHFNGLGSEVARVVAMENPGGISNTVANQLKLLKRRCKLILDLSRDPTFSRLFNPLTPSWPDNSIGIMRRRRPTADVEYLLGMGGKCREPQRGCQHHKSYLSNHFYPPHFLWLICQNACILQSRELIAAFLTAAFVWFIFNPSDCQALCLFLFGIGSAPTVLAWRKPTTDRRAVNCQN